MNSTDKIKTFISIAIITIALYACETKQSKPQKFLDEKQMEELLIDISLAKASETNTRRPSKDTTKPYFTLQQTYQMVYDKHNITAQEFEELNKWYLTDPTKYLEVYNKVMHQLNQMKAELEQEYKEIEADKKHKTTK